MGTDLELIGRTVSHYRILEAIGAGGMGVVYKAEDTRLGRLVALKMISEGFRGPTAIERLKREARAASALNHPNICTIYEIDEAEGQPFIVMELLEGQTLRDCGSLPYEQLLDLAIEFADALAAAQSAHIIHRDLKPANLFLTSLGHLKILDFGLAKLIAERDDSPEAATAAHDLTASNTALGTVGYMSPEQARGQPLDARSDIFSFGAVVYELATGRNAFPGSTGAAVFDGILHDNPAPPTQPGLAPIVMKALEKDRELRYQSAADIRADLKRLKHDSGVLAAAPARSWMRWAVAAIVIVAIAIAAWRFRPAASSGATHQTTIAVLPFANLGSNHERDYLSLALPDELITILSHSRALAVRPFAMTRKFTGEVDPQQTGQSLNVTDVITGHFRDSGGKIGITLEAVDVDKNNVLWRASIDAPAEDLIAMRNEMSNRIRTGLLPFLHAGEQGEQNRPTSDEAYALFLRASAASNDAQPNKEALALLERAVALDPNYAPAWAALGARAHYDASYAGGGDVALRQAEAASTRALSLDGDLLGPAWRLIVMRVEDGDLENGYLQARDFLKRRPDTADAHFTMSYVLRYAGLLGESAAECDRVLAIDPRNSLWRTCSVPNLFLGDTRKAREFIKLDGGSSWSRSLMIDVFDREGRAGEATRIVGSVPANSIESTSPWRAVRTANLRHLSGAAFADVLRQAVDGALRIRDGESMYFTAINLGHAGAKEETLRVLGAAIATGYCSYPAMDHDPAFDAIRGTPQFKAIRDAGRACQQRFLEFRARNPS